MVYTTPPAVTVQCYRYSPSIDDGAIATVAVVDGSSSKIARTTYALARCILQRVYDIILAYTLYICVYILRVSYMSVHLEYDDKF